ncbi:DUF4097 family beta strand repeat-containing protein [Lewinella sp. IMCC34191]|uniref:DUF4097 family beta strand repeat-containing protein n=1 Tax=Lewinella sp. IMCC34191 TaxID=2259172 RepID=UPI001300BBB1|nr:DUF4097 family beta strand repeat-containing protein [Lewinella sp. IMCC34191]
MKARILPLLFLVAAWLPLASADRPVTKFEKEITETYNIDANGRVRLDNRYGEIKVSTWTQSKVKINVLIQVDARDEDAFQDVLDRIDIGLSGNGSTVSAVTSISSNRRSDSWWSLLTGGSSSDDFKIYYDVTLPASVSLEVEARYCDVQLPSLTGETFLDIGYGDLVAGRLSNRTQMEISYGSARVDRIGDNSTLEFRYSEGIIRNAGDLRYDGRYSEVRFGTTGVLRLDVGYDEIDVTSAKEVYLEGNYNELAVEEAGAVYIDGNYTDINLGVISQGVRFDGNYGDLEIERLVSGFSFVTVDASYSDIQINVDEDAGYQLDLRARYGDISAPTDGLSPRNVGSESSSEYVKGTKAGNGNGRITISTNYGDIDLY